MSRWIQMNVAAWNTLQSHPKVLAKLRELGEVCVTDAGEAVDPNDIHIDIHNGTVTITVPADTPIELRAQTNVSDAFIKPPRAKGSKAQWKRDRGLGRFAR